MKPGITTTEFWASVATAAGAVVAAVGDKIPASWAGAIAAAAAVAYNVSRGWAKSSGQPEAPPAKKKPAAK